MDEKMKPLWKISWWEMGNLVKLWLQGLSVGKCWAPASSCGWRIVPGTTMSLSPLLETKGFKVFTGTKAWKWFRSWTESNSWLFATSRDYPSLRARRQNRLSICGSKCLLGEGSAGRCISIITWRGGYIFRLLVTWLVPSRIILHYV